MIREAKKFHDVHLQAGEPGKPVLREKMRDEVRSLCRFQGSKAPEPGAPRSEDN